jgi:hypothetical protein
MKGLKKEYIGNCFFCGIDLYEGYSFADITSGTLYCIDCIKKTKLPENKIRIIR